MDEDDKGKNKARREYEVGYCKPPKQTRFRKGISGNPRGRPRGAKNKPAELQPGLLRDVFLSEGARTITIQDGGRMKSVTILQAAFRRLFAEAARGRIGALTLVAKCASAISLADEALHNEHVQTLIEYKVDAERKLEHRARLGITDAPELLPHPDDIVIDFRTGEARIKGPMSKEEKLAFDNLREWADVFREGEKELVQQIKRARSAKRRQALDDMLEDVRAKAAQIERALS